MSTVVSVALGERSYDIVIGADVLADIGAHVKSGKVFVLTDENVAGIYLDRFIKSLASAKVNIAGTIVVKPGENSKSFNILQDIINQVLEKKPERSSTLIALGGGVIGDLGGFAASVILRGIPFIQIPTTLLAQVDSAVGGKTGINTAQGKNLVGSFYQPRLVLADMGVLKTLPRREMLAGYAEVVKYALINDAAFFEFLDQNVSQIIAGDPGLLSRAVEVSCRSKAAIVARDEKETSGVRDLLNLGHTFGHALEAMAGYDGRLLHGEAVAIGIRYAAEFSRFLGLCPDADVRKINAHFDKAGLPQKPPFAVDATKMIAAMKQDKKVKDGQIGFILLSGIGKAFRSDTVMLDKLEEFLQGRH